MATKSILKNVNIKDKKTAEQFTVAMENAHKKKAKAIKTTRGVSEASREDIRRMFGANG